MECELERKRLIKLRGTIKGKLTLFKKFLDNSINDQTIGELQLRLTKFEQCWAEFNEIQTKVELIDDNDDNSTDHLQEREDFETQYFKLFSQAQNYIKKHVSPNCEVSTASPASYDQAGNISGAMAVSVRLPPINLPTFSGRYDEWMPFFDSFQSLIHNNSSLSNIQKLQYLKSALSGQAADTLQNIDLLAQNYQIALDLLTKQYHNTRLIVQQHIKALFDLPHVQRDISSSLMKITNYAQTHLRALNALNVNTDNWDPMIIHLITTRLDANTHKEWEFTNKPDELPKLDNLIDFLQQRSQTLETIASNRSSILNHDKLPFLQSKPLQPYQQKTKSHLTTHDACPICNKEHQIYYCQELMQATQEERLRKIKQAKLCINCLGRNHSINQCKTTQSCKKCGKRHHTFLHIDSSTQHLLSNFPTKPTTEFTDKTKVNTNTSTSTTNISSTHTTRQDSSEVLLSTALVDIVNPDGYKTTCRAFLDSGSQSNFITETVCQRLGLRKKSAAILVSGINQGSTRISHVVTATLKSRNSNFEQTSEFLVLPKITSLLPIRPVDTTYWNFPQNINLADPIFAEPGKIDILLGQEYFLDILQHGRIKEHNMPTLQNTKLGWIVGGRANDNKTFNLTTCHTSIMDQIDQQLQQFWKIEEIVPQRKLMSEEDKNCEEHYSNTIRRGEDGRYTVTMPLKGQPDELGTSKEVATRRFFQVERRFQRQPEICKQYIDFMKEYEGLAHMESEPQEIATSYEYYLPHHPVLKDSSTTTKLRVVFDASAKTSTSLSLNDILMIGPTLQDDLFSMTIRFRLHKYVMTADIEKMYRQIWIDESQRQLLKIIWRESESKNLQTFHLNTVTYGTACAPYLATRTLQQLAKDEERRFPQASSVVLRDFYVDDLLTGTDSLEEAINLQKQLIELLKSGGFNLRKWNSNHEQLLLHLPAESREGHLQDLTTNHIPSTNRTLGLLWNSKEDQLRFSYNLNDVTQLKLLTKRNVLSAVAKLFDPLGLVAPIVIQAKILLQDLWQLGLNWDEALPPTFQTKWLQFQEGLSTLNEIEVKRGVILTSLKGTVELHGFCDASERAYGAAVYVRHVANDSTITSNLLCSKSRVAPLKTVSLPRLELCGALLLAELLSHVRKALRGIITNAFYWTDSTIVLSWLASEAACWKTFVANRVAKIQELTKSTDWKHVKSHENPADLVSRGVKTRDLLQSNIWWFGPNWLTEDSINWTTSQTNSGQNINIPERNKKAISASTVIESNINHTLELISRFSSLQKLERVISYVLRFIYNCRFPHSKQTGTLTPLELTSSLMKLIKSEQQYHFWPEITKLKKRSCVSQNSKLLTLNPFLDEEGIIRVGGRLEHSQLHNDSKHPIVLSNKCYLTELIARNEHVRHLHAGPQLLLSAIRQQFWPLDGRNICRKTVHKCVTCFRAKPKSYQPGMGNLPSARITPSRPFSHTGVDYCGPVYIRSSRARRHTLVKSYIAVFICFTTKAIHVELVSDLTTDAFLAALKRFISRRGICQHIYSDNGTNFVGASNELKNLYDLLKSEKHQQGVINATSHQKITWHFIPPKSPHFGGLWEAGVKSVKYHLKRIIGKANLTFEQLSTTLTMIEACLNSRPLTALPTNSNDPVPLTPGHFLIGEALTSLPEPDFKTTPINRLSHWERAQQLTQHFWNRWSREYLSQLQHRPKWATGSNDIKPGVVVLVKEDNLPPMKWITAIVDEIHPGADGQTRVVTIRTPSGLYKRAANRLCILPIGNQ